MSGVPIEASVSSATTTIELIAMLGPLDRSGDVRSGQVDHRSIEPLDGLGPSALRGTHQAFASNAFALGSVTAHSRTHARRTAGNRRRSPSALDRRRRGT